MSLIDRYIFREALTSWFLVMLVLFAIFMTNQLAEILGEAATDRLPREAVLAVFGLTAMRYITLLTPISLFLGITLALARFNRDGEMAALAACGVGPSRLLLPIGVLTFGLAAVLAWLAFESMPAASRRIEEVRHLAERSTDLAVIEAGKFTSPDDGQTVLYAREAEAGTLGDVFIESQQGDRVVAVMAARANHVVDEATGEQSFALYDGRRYEGVPGQGQFLVIDFAEGRLPIRTEEEEQFVATPAEKSTLALLQSTALEDRAELHWRASLLVSLFVLSLLAVPLSRASPREGRYARLGMALLIYIIYTNLLSIGRVWIERGLLGDGVGLWWIHAIVMLAALFMLARESGWFIRARPVRMVAA